MTNDETLSRDEMSEAIIQSPHVLAWADSIGLNDSRKNGGRPMHHGAYSLVLLHALAKKVYEGKVRETLTELHPRQWKWLQAIVAATYPERQDLWLPDDAPKRHHYTYFRDRYLTTDTSVAFSTDLVVKSGVEIADERELCQPGSKSLMSPGQKDCLVADGKVIASASRYKPGTEYPDPTTGEIKVRRSDTDHEYTEGGEDTPTLGHRFVILSARAAGWYNRAILGVAPSITGSELDVLIPMLEEINQWLQATAVIFDGAARGVHINAILRAFGIICIAPVLPKKTDRRGGKRVEHQVKVGKIEARHKDGRMKAVEVWAERGAACEMHLAEDGKRVLMPMALLRLDKRANVDTFRLYGDYETEDGFVLRVPLYQTEADAARKFNTCEYLRPFSMDGDVYKALYSTRPSAESVNRQIEDCLWQKRANVFTQRRVHVDLLVWAIADNAISAYVFRRERAGPPLSLAA